MPELRRLRADHIPALLAFERENRAWFAARVPDRGDDYFAHFEERIHALLAEQEAGVCHFHVLVGTGGEVLAGSTSSTWSRASPTSATGSRSGPPGRAWPPGPYGRSAPSPPVPTG